MKEKVHNVCVCVSEERSLGVIKRKWIESNKWNETLNWIEMNSQRKKHIQQTHTHRKWERERERARESEENKAVKDEILLQEERK